MESEEGGGGDFILLRGNGFIGKSWKIDGTGTPVFVVMMF